MYLHPHSVDSTKLIAISSNYMYYDHNILNLLTRDPGFVPSPQTSDNNQIFFISQLCNRLSDELGVQQREELLSNLMVKDENHTSD